MKNLVFPSAVNTHAPRPTFLECGRLWSVVIYVGKQFFTGSSCFKHHCTSMQESWLCAGFCVFPYDSPMDSNGLSNGFPLSSLWMSHIFLCSSLMYVPIESNGCLWLSYGPLTTDSWGFLQASYGIHGFHNELPMIMLDLLVYSHMGLLTGPLPSLMDSCGLLWLPYGNGWPSTTPSLQPPHCESEGSLWLWDGFPNGFQWIA